LGRTQPTGQGSCHRRRGVFQRVTQIVIPSASTASSPRAIFVTIFVWKEYMIACIFSGTSVRTAPLVLYQILSPVTGVSRGLLFAASTVQLMPCSPSGWCKATR
jgi:ABC-type glycerol-3-phosphate transport system permease component